MEQYTENLYDDDLTVGVDEYDDFVQTDDVDLFEFYGEEESSISRLKTIVLSIDWEITDENLQDFNDELLVLKEEQLTDKVNLVYIQALEKIGKYISKEKSNSNHNAVKLLQSFFYTLEKNISSGTVTDEEKKKTLSEDVKKFEKLKEQISSSGKAKKKSPPPPSPEKPAETPALSTSPTDTAIDDGDSPIRNLKAIILGMDWEITDKELTELGQEVKRLQGVYKGAKPKLIFLQGIDSIGAYIKKKKSNSHADAFKLLHSFCEKLDYITSTPLSIQEEKAVLLPEVEKFNKFKEVVIATIDSEEESVESKDYDDDYGEMPPAFADVGEDVRGFQVDEEAATLQDDELAVGEKIGSFFDDGNESGDGTQKQVSREETVDTVNSFFDEEPEDGPAQSIDENVALQGVDVETEADDDSDEEPLPFTASGELAPALAGDDVPDESEGGQDSWEDSEEASEVFAKLDGFFGEDEELEAEPDTGTEEPAEALAGVDVETEADDESDEEPLPFADSGEIAPALAGFDDETEDVTEEDLEAGVEESFDNLFGDDESFDTFKDADEERTEDNVETVEVSNLSDEDETLTADDDLVAAFDDVEEDVEPALAFEEEDELPAALEDQSSETAFSDAESEDEIEDLFGEDNLFTADEDIVEDSIALDSDDAVEDEVDTLAVAAENLDTFSFDEDAPDVVLDEGDEEVVFELADEDDEIESVIADEAVSIADSEEPVELTEDSDESFDAVFELVEEEITGENDLVADISDEEPSLGLDEEDTEETLLFDEPEAGVEGDLDVQEDLVEDDVLAALSDVDDEEIEIQEEPEETVEEIEAAFTEEPLPDESAEDFLHEYEEDLEAYFKSTGLDAENDVLANLRAGVSSIGVELDDSIINSLLGEVQDVGQKYNDKPVAKTMLQLMSTVIQHINQYRYEASSDAHSLLLSIFDKLEMIDRGDVNDTEAQEILLEETSKILTWQQTMLDRQAVVKGDVLTFMDPLRSETGSEKAGEFVFTKLDIIDEDDLVEEDPFGFEEEEISMESEDLLEESDISEHDNDVTEEHDEQSLEDEGVGKDDITALIKEEMKALRASFQEEINNLKKELGK